MKNSKRKPNLPLTYEAHITVAASENSPARLVHVNLDPQETKIVQAFANDCGMTLDALVRSYVGPGLPAQDHWRGPGLAALPFPSLSFDSRCPELRARLERAAKFDGGMSMEEYVYAAVTSGVETTEYDMRFHVETGELVEHTRLEIDLRPLQEHIAPTLREQRGEVQRHYTLSPGYEEQWTEKLPLPIVSPLATYNALMPVGTPLKPLEVTLSPEATLALLHYHQVNGDELIDTVSDILADEIEHALGYITQLDAAGWLIFAGEVAAATRLRIDRGAKPQHDTSGFEPMVVLTFEPTIHALLTATALKERYDSVEAMLLQLSSDEC